MIIKYHLAKIRKTKKLSLSELSERSNVSKSCINEIERGKKKPLFETVCRLAAALEVPIYKERDVHNEQKPTNT